MSKDRSPCGIGLPPRLREINRAGIAFHDKMKALNAKIAVVLITMGAVVLMVSVTPPQGTIPCLAPAIECAQTAAQAAQAATVTFFEYLFSGIALISVAALLLISGRNRGSSVSVGSS